MSNLKQNDANEYWLKGIREQTPEVLKALFKEFLPGISSFIKSNGGTAADAEDIFMDALEAIWRKIQAGDFTLTCAFFSFIYEVCRRLWLKKIRRKKFDAGVTPEDLMVSRLVDEVREEMETTERYKLYRDKMTLLGEDCQKILQFFYREEKSHAEIAEIMGLTAGYAKKRAFECKQKLTEKIKDDPRFDELMSPATTTMDIQNPETTKSN